MGNHAEHAHQDSGWGDINDELELEKDDGKSHPIKVDLSEEERLKQLEEGGILTERQAESINRLENARRLNAIAEALAAHIQTKLSTIGAEDVRVIPVPEKGNEDALDLVSRVEIRDRAPENQRGGRYYLDIKLSKVPHPEIPNKKILTVRDLYIPPALNSIRDNVLSIFEQMKTYGNLSPHSVE